MSENHSRLVNRQPPVILARSDFMFFGTWSDKLKKSPKNSPNGEDKLQEKSSQATQDTPWSVLRSVFRRSYSDRSPGDLASELRKPSPSLYSELRKYLKDPDWARAFIKENGVDTLLETLKSLQGRNFEEVQLKVECGQCLRLVMDSRVGLDYIMENADYTQKLATGKIFCSITFLHIKI
ncbi:drf_GBD domain-containing protein [Caerostris darwini]|uniref:Drf_GBD domain-containing protein n=1 Tax=Caerostris darwini TaxID=1538125 RepID=A0AAV4U3L1_9ARAC|nr:drf_GBD domain-containing protein [Caerostris darwini]